MTRRCTNCHRFIEGAPTPELVHVGKYGSDCKSTHHPHPCDFLTKTGPCTYYTVVSSPEKVVSDSLTTEQLQVRDAVRQAEMEKMAADLVNLQNKQNSMDSMAAELVELKEMLTKIRPSPPVGGSLAHVNSIGHNQTSDLNNSVVTTGNNTNADGSDFSHLGAAGLVSQQSLMDDVNSHIQNNTVPPATIQSRGSYTGPTMTELRKDPELNAAVMKVLAAFGENIPQIKETLADPQVRVSATSVNTNQIPYPTYTNPQQIHNTRTTTSFPRPIPSVQFQPSGSIFGMNPPQQMQPTLLPQPGYLPHMQTPLRYPVSNHPAYYGVADIGNSQLAGAGPNGDRPGNVPASTSRGTVLSDEEFLDAAAIMQLCTVSNRRQLRPHEFARMGRFSYASKITDKNITIPLYVLGYLQHVVALIKGVVPVQTDTEVVDRLVNLMTIMEITANNSTLEDFKSPGWSIGLEYAGRIFHDIEYGRVKWEDLSQGLQPHTFLYAKDTVEMQQGKNIRGGGQQRGRGRGRGGRGRGVGNAERPDDSLDGSRVCQSYNGFWTGSGCAFEYSSNRKCSYEHYCSTCYNTSGKKETHKAVYCPDQRTVTSSNSMAAVTSG